MLREPIPDSAFLDMALYMALAVVIIAMLSLGTYFLSREGQEVLRGFLQRNRILFLKLALACLLMEIMSCGSAFFLQGDVSPAEWSFYAPNTRYLWLLSAGIPILFTLTAAFVIFGRRLIKS